jgi:hypothetical protein
MEIPKLKSTKHLNRWFPMRPRHRNCGLSFVGTDLFVGTTVT